MKRYVTDENLPTEHAKLDDNDDGHGSELQDIICRRSSAAAPASRVSPRSGPKTMAPWRQRPPSMPPPVPSRESENEHHNPRPRLYLHRIAAQAPVAKQKSADANAERLKFMKDSVQIYELASSGKNTAVFKLQSDPAFRLGKQGDGVVLEGAIFLWADEVGRPEAAAQVFLMESAGRRDGEWRHEFTSLSTEAFRATQGGKARWLPMMAGVEFQPIAGAPKPADAPGNGFGRCETWPASSGPKTTSGAGDGMPSGCSRNRSAGTARPAARPKTAPCSPSCWVLTPKRFCSSRAQRLDGLEWQYAFAPMTCWALKAEHKGRSVWSLAFRNSSNPFRTFFSRIYEP